MSERNSARVDRGMHMQKIIAGDPDLKCSLQPDLLAASLMEPFGASRNEVLEAK